MTDKTTAAFPCHMSEQTHLNQDCAPFQHGMSLRDYFAAKAMQALIHVQVKTKLVQTTETAYEWADAMLRAREQP